MFPYFSLPKRKSRFKNGTHSRGLFQITTFTESSPLVAVLHASLCGGVPLRACGVQPRLRINRTVPVTVISALSAVTSLDTA